jgi:hypothetical protein
MNVPMPGGMFVTAVVDKNGGTDDDDDGVAARTELSIPPPPPPRRAAAARDSSSTLTSDPSVSSTVLSELNCVHSFDDQGRAASYLQFFKKNQQRKKEQHHHQFDAFNIDLTTRTPNRMTAANLMVPPPPLASLQPQKRIHALEMVDHHLLENDNDEESTTLDSGTAVPTSENSPPKSPPCKLYDDSAAASYSSDSDNETSHPSCASFATTQPQGKGTTTVVVFATVLGSKQPRIFRGVLPSIHHQHFYDSIS